MNPTLEKIFTTFEQRGNEKYGDEDVSQLQHALQAGCLARDANVSPSLVAAALLHDIGHIFHTQALPENCETDLHDHHEMIGHQFLRQHFGATVADPVRLHVAAKRYLCTKDPAYQNELSPTSLKSFFDQGGMMNEAELAEFESEPHFSAALMLRRWDDTAKLAEFDYPDIREFLPELESALSAAKAG